LPTLEIKYQVLGTKGVGKGQYELWLCTYTPQKGPAEKFQIHMFKRVEKGVFVALPNTTCPAFVRDLGKVLDAKHPPKQLPHESQLPFDAIMLGEHLSRQKNGALSNRPPGPWTDYKMFFGDDEAEMFMDVDPRSHRAQFSLKDSDYGDYLVSQLDAVYGKR
jgi:hypothetical protein